ncbi:MAG: hypothetical protein ABW321_22675 [Polyangiales bacterium]
MESHADGAATDRSTLALRPEEAGVVIATTPVVETTTTYAGGLANLPPSAASARHIPCLVP